MKRLFCFIFLSLLSLQLFAQTIISHEEYKKLKNVNDIYQIEGTDILIIPENMLNEFMRSYNPQKYNLGKVNDIILDGYVADAMTTTPLEGINILFQLWNESGPYDTLETTTNSQGYYSFNITDVDDFNQIVKIGQIEYFGGQARITTNSTKKILIKKYNTIGEQIGSTINKIISGTEIINLSLQENQRTIVVIEVDGEKYAQLHLLHNHIHSISKNIEQLINGPTKILRKIKWIGGLVYIFDPLNQFHGYSDGTGEMNNNTQRDFSLIPRINLEFPITDPEYTVIPTINTLRDLLWYTARVQGDWDNKNPLTNLYPIQLFIDTVNAPANGVVESRNIIQYFQDSLGIHPDSLIKESPTDITPAFANGFSAAKIIWTDSIGTEGYNSIIDVIFSSSHSTFIGTRIYIDTNKVHGQDNGKYIAYQLQRYITAGVNPVNNPNYLGYTTGTRIGPRKRPNNDEKKTMQMGRYHKPYYTNRVYP